MAEAEEEVEERRVRSRKPLILLLLAVVLAIGAVVLWSARKPIARDAVDRALRDRGVAARYEISHIGFRYQRLEKIVIGDPRHPDLTADWAEVEFGFSGISPSVRKIRASGVRLRGKLVNGVLSLGAVDRLMPPPSGKPFTLPDIDVSLHDARMALATPMGSVGLALEGAGNLTDGFSGQIAAIARGLNMQGCVLDRPSAVLHVTISDRRPAADGPIRAGQLRCGATRIGSSQGMIDVALGEALDRWNGGVMFAVSSADSGAYGGANLRGRIGFQGNIRNTDAKFNMSVDRVRAGDSATLFDGYDGTPVGPLAVALRNATQAAMRSMTMEGAINLETLRDRKILRLAPLTVRTESGARLDLSASGNRGIGWQWPEGTPLLDAGVTLSGGGFPDISARLRRVGHAVEGSFHMPSFAAGGARLMMEPLIFAKGRFSTRLKFDGPLADGRIEGLDIPVDGRMGDGGSLLINPACSTLGFSRLVVAGTQIGETRLPLCPLGAALFVRDARGRIAGGARIDGPRLRGTVGESPLVMTAQRITASIGRPGFMLDRLAIRLGTGADPTRLDVVKLDGAVDSAGMSGTLAGAAGKIGNVPLLISDGGGRWRLRGSVLDLAGRLDVADAAPDPRFQPLASDNVTLTLRNGVISGGGDLKTPKAHAMVSHVTLKHDLSNGAGNAVLDVPHLTFDPTLQPEMLTQLTLGVIANVRGTVKGQGRIGWDRRGVRSNGDFATDSLNLAAAFGPVENLSGKIHFSDLLAMATPPGQTVKIGAINTGVAVNDGVVVYQLLPGQHLKVESGRWPFSGGELLLEPTQLDFGRPSDRHLTFRINGMDSALFVQQFGFKNIAVTGIFDGVLPMIFDVHGGRIEGGRLLVQKAGGRLSYVGEISNEKLGRFGNMAFDALKSIRYSNLLIELDGSLDGEIVSKVIFTGTNEAPVAKRKGLLRGLVGLPFKFNITIKAPFRSLVNSAQSINDPRSLISGSLKDYRARQTQPASVQPQESEKVP